MRMILGVLNSKNQHQVQTLVVETISVGSTYIIGTDQVLELKSKDLYSLILLMDLLLVLYHLRIFQQMLLYKTVLLSP